ncbi:PREDICTED: uncharacterized protein LOC106125875 [Papilio xuthus]|uniref:Uncharacterized protein LOC106125875 n=1 Tax=Papilio xuthus TaxID=66420 RepID=A0AAJ7EIL6_PAPXU|nr:PREDICTED: uncharacterized protein LOC106125875 [Papilio xuthus]
MASRANIKLCSPIRHRSPSEGVTRRKKNQPDVDSASSDCTDITKEIKLLRQALSGLNSNLTEAIQSIQECSKRLDDVTTKIELTEKRLSDLENRQTKENIELKSQVAMLMDKVNTQEQLLLKNEIEIAGVPESRNESLRHIVKLVGNKIGVDVTDEDLDLTMRAGPRNSTKPNISRSIVVRFLRKQKKDDFLSAAKIRKNITSKDITPDVSEHKIYINERLTKQNRYLFRETRFRTKQSNFKYCWAKNGLIYVREKEGKAATLIRTIADLDNMFGPGDTNSESK